VDLKKANGRSHRHILANVWEVRQRRHCGDLPARRNWPGGVSLAFGLTLLTMAYAIGHVSGCHINPAVTIGLAAGGRFPLNEIGPYVVAQVVGAVVGAGLLYIIANGAPDFAVSDGFAANGYGAHSPGHYDLLSCFITEVIMTMMFLFIIMGSTHGRAPVGFAPIAIGFGLALIHLVSIPVRSKRSGLSSFPLWPGGPLFAFFASRSRRALGA
jgi:MIP family channel proteins